VRGRVVLKYVGQLAALQAVLLCAPVLAALAFGELQLTGRYLAVAALLAAVGVPLARLPGVPRLLANEALVVTALAFVVSPLLMTIPFAGAGIAFGDALFESVSAITTTGLSTLHSVERLPRTFLFARAWMQWYGGLGIVVLSVALLAGQGGVARRFIEPEGGAENLVTTVRLHARRVLAVYAILTVAGIGAVWLAGAGASYGIDHVLAAVSTGGFSTFDSSLAGFGSAKVVAVLSVLSVCGAVGLPLYYRAWHAGAKELWRDPEMRALAAALSLTVGALFAVTAYLDGVPWLQALRHAAVLGVSAQTTTGFSDAPVSLLGNAGLLVLIFAMAAGGCVGSTAGGVKLLRVLVLLRVARVALRRTGATAHAMIEPTLGGRPIAEADLVKALLLLVLFGGVVLLSWFVFVAFGHEPLRSLFEVVSATATVGLSTGLTGPELEPALKLLLGVDMLLGRLEVVALLVLIYPRTWVGKRVEEL
jgi:trk system potassium uptake protein TrkH